MNAIASFQNDNFVIYTLNNEKGQPVAVIPARILDQVFEFWVSLTDEQRKYHFIDQKVFNMNEALPKELDDLFQKNLLEILA